MWRVFKGGVLILFTLLFVDVGLALVPFLIAVAVIAEDVMAGELMAGVMAGGGNGWGSDGWGSGLLVRSVSDLSKSGKP